MFLIALTLIATEPPRAMAVEVVRDPINDRIRASAIVRDDGNRLVVSCSPGQYDGRRVVFHSRRWLARGHILSGARPLVYRFDSDPPRRMLWATDRRHATLSSGRRVASFLARLATAERLVIRARDMEGRRFDTVFRLKDVGPALDRALAACSGGSQEAG